MSWHYTRLGFIATFAWQGDGFPHSARKDSFLNDFDISLARCARHCLPESASLLQELVEEGKVRAIGISEAPMEDAKKIHSVVPVSVVELRWALCSRDAEASFPFELPGWDHAVQ